jgi:23S rRNA (pseudouridine1915-N3)-methyltransferase
LGRFAKLEFIELQDEKTPDNAIQVANEQILKKSLIALCQKSLIENLLLYWRLKELNSLQRNLVKKLDTITTSGYSDITFVIGGSLGLDSVVKNRANLLMSFGKLTLPHQLMRLVLIEQIYRAFMIQQGSPYHK